MAIKNMIIGGIQAAHGECIEREDGVEIGGVFFPYNALPAGQWEVSNTPGQVAPAVLELPREIPLYKVKNELIDRGEDSGVEAWLGAMQGNPGKKARNLWAMAPMFLPHESLGQAYKKATSKTDAEYHAFCWAAYNRKE